MIRGGHRLHSSPPAAPGQGCSDPGGGDAHRVFTAAELFRDRRRLLGDVPAVRLGVFLGQLILDLKHLFDERVGAPLTLWAIAFCTLVLTSLMWSLTTAVNRALAYWLLAAMKSLQKETR